MKCTECLSKIEKKEIADLFGKLVSARFLNIEDTDEDAQEKIVEALDDLQTDIDNLYNQLEMMQKSYDKLHDLVIK